MQSQQICFPWLQTLRLGNSAINEISTGRIVNLMSSDIEKFNLVSFAYFTIIRHFVILYHLCKWWLTSNPFQHIKHLKWIILTHFKYWKKPFEEFRHHFKRHLAWITISNFGKEVANRWTIISSFWWFYNSHVNIWNGAEFEMDNGDPLQ